MDFAANFTAIDFETANRRSDSACQLAAVAVREGRIADSAMWMIRPRPLYFSRANVQIHGITPSKIKNEPEFGDLWPEIAQRFGDDCLVAHNAAFDIGVLLACLRTHGRSIPELHFTCTRQIARRTWPGRRRYGLKPLSDWLGIRFQHHDALEDSIACAKVLLAAGIDSDATDLPDLERKLRIQRGTAGPWGQKGPAGRTRSRKRTVTQSVASPSLPFHWPGDTGSVTVREPTSTPSLDLQRLMIRAEFIRPLTGQIVVFAGGLCRLSRDDAETLAARLGGDCQETVTERTDLVVVGSGKEPAGAVRSDEIVSRQAEQRRADGKQIQILNEDEFLGLVISQKA